MGFESIVRGEDLDVRELKVLLVVMLLATACDGTTPAVADLASPGRSTTGCLTLNRPAPWSLANVVWNDRRRR
jgi:hypothetical protein